MIEWTLANPIIDTVLIKFENKGMIFTRPGCGMCCVKDEAQYKEK